METDSGQQEANTDGVESSFCWNGPIGQRGQKLTMRLQSCGREEK